MLSKKLLSIASLALAVILISCCTAFASDFSVSFFPYYPLENRENRVINQTLYTDICAYIDGVRIDSYNIDGNTVIITEDLAKFGFSVVWNGDERSLTLNEGDKKITASPAAVESVQSELIGKPKDNVYSTDIRTYCAGNMVPQSYNIGGSTLIGFDVLSAFGNVEWDNNTRSITFTRFGLSDGMIIASAGNSTAETSIMNYSKSIQRWSNVSSSFVYEDEGLIKTVDVAKGSVFINAYTSDGAFSIVSSTEIKLELPLFGGFYSGKEYNYLVCGEANKEENDDKTVIRIIKYGKDFSRLSSLDIKGEESITTIPFDCATSNMCENADGSELVLHTGRERYTSGDGLNHQSQLTMVVDTEKMTLKNTLGDFQTNHVSHSFGQYVRYEDDGSHVLVDHGDAFPRSVVLNKSDGNDRYFEKNLFKIPGRIGANCTGVTVGGFEISDSNYIVAINSIDHGKIDDYNSFTMTGENFKRDERDIVLCLLDRDNLNSMPKTVYLTDYVDNKLCGSTPRLVKLSDNRFAVLWEEYSTEDKEYSGGWKFKAAYCAVVNGDGNVLNVNTLPKNCRLSADCTPIYDGERIVWYIINNETRYFYSIQP